MAAVQPDTDDLSVFNYEDGDSETFSSRQLSKVVADYFATACTLRKIGEGGYHKVYEVIRRHDSKGLDAVVRVASSAFPGDKMLSEVATLKYIAARTSIPVPHVYKWNVDSSNPVGAEYMIMQKVPGISPDVDKWKTLPVSIKLRVVEQVAEHLAILFSQRFSQAGSLYLSSDETSRDFTVGPIVSVPFYRMVDGIVEYPDMTPDVRDALTAMRGPFTSASEYLSSTLKATLLKLDRFRDTALADIDSDDPATTLDKAKTVMQLGIELCRSYPGDRPVPSPIRTPDRPFTVLLDDFRLVNMLIDEDTGKVNGYIDFESTTVAPLWQCATVPQWIPDPDKDMANWYGGTPEDQRAIWSAFHTTIDRHDQALTGGEWRRAYELGEPFRMITDRLGLGVQFWDGAMEGWIKERLDWSMENPGVGMPEKED